MSLNNNVKYWISMQAQLQAALSEKEEWQQRAVKFEDTCETLRVLSRSAIWTRGITFMLGMSRNSQCGQLIG